MLHPRLRGWLQMLFDDFAEICRTFWSDYFRKISEHKAAGQLNPGGDSLLLPSMLLVMRFKNFYVCELMGAVDHFRGLTMKKHRGGSIYEYLDQFGADDPVPAISINGGGHILKRLSLA